MGSFKQLSPLVTARDIIIIFYKQEIF